MPGVLHPAGARELHPGVDLAGPAQPLRGPCGGRGELGGQRVVLGAGLRCPFVLVTELVSVAAFTAGGFVGVGGVEFVTGDRGDAHREVPGLQEVQDDSGGTVGVPGEDQGILRAQDTGFVDSTGVSQGVGDLANVVRATTGCSTVCGLDGVHATSLPIPVYGGPLTGELSLDAQHLASRDHQAGQPDNHADENDPWISVGDHCIRGNDRNDGQRN